MQDLKKIKPKYTIYIPVVSLTYHKRKGLQDSALLQSELA